MKAAKENFKMLTQELLIKLKMLDVTDTGN